MKRSPKLPFLIALTGDNLFIFRVHLIQNNTTIKTTINEHNIFIKMPPLLSKIIEKETDSSNNFPKGIPATKPIKVPIIAIVKYFIRYNNLILKLLIPIAFITPISRYSCVIVKEIVNFNTTNAMSIRQILTTIRTPDNIIFIIYAIFKVSLLINDIIVLSF